MPKGCIYYTLEYIPYCLLLAFAEKNSPEQFMAFLCLTIVCTIGMKVIGTGPDTINSR